MKFLIALFCLLCPGLLLLGETPPPREEATKADPHELPVKMWYLPFDPHLGHDRPPEEVPEAEAQRDARAWLDGVVGVRFAPGEEAVFNARLRILMVRARAETIGLVDAYAREQWPLFPVAIVRLEVSLVEFSGLKMSDLNGETPVETLRKAAGDSWHVLNRMQVVTKSGQRAMATSRTGPPGEKPDAAPPGENPPPPDDSSRPLRPGEFGATLEIEPVIDPPFGRNIDVNVAYHFRATGTPSWDWTTTVPTSAKDGLPEIIQLDSAALNGDHSQPTKIRALILRADVVYLDKLVPQPAKLSGAPVASPPPKP